MMHRGDIRWYQLRAPDKRRPVLILTRNSALEYVGEATIAPITTTIRDIPSEVALSKSDGVPQDCAINLDHIQTVSRGKVGGLITRLGDHKMEQVRTALLFALGYRS
jgi:mRNA interferase MazF